MKNFIFGLIIGALIVSLCFTITIQQKQIAMLEAKQKTICKDVEAIWFKIMKK